MQTIKQEQELIDLSKKKWDWMAECKVDALDALFHEKAVFVHMGGSWGKAQELKIISDGGIHYKKADIHKVSVNVIGTTAILLNRITLLAVVGGNEVTNPFMREGQGLAGYEVDTTWLRKSVTGLIPRSTNRR